jgi:hypothetical protein
MRRGWAWSPVPPGGAIGRPARLTTTWPGAVPPTPGPRAFARSRVPFSGTACLILTWPGALAVGLFPGRAPGRVTCPREPHLHSHGLAHRRGGRTRRPASTGSAVSAPANLPARGPLRRERRRGARALSRLRAWLVRRVVPHRPAPRLPAGDREVSPDSPVWMQHLGARAVALPPGHQHQPRSPLVPVPAPLGIGPPRRTPHSHPYD